MVEICGKYDFTSFQGKSMLHVAIETFSECKSNILIFIKKLVCLIYILIFDIKILSSTLNGTHTAVRVLFSMLDKILTLQPIRAKRVLEMYNTINKLSFPKFKVT